MHHVIEPETHLRHGKGPFRIHRIRPGLGIRADDTGFGALGLVDRAQLSAGLVVPMHEHVDDEIVSYLRSGEMTHHDASGRTETVSANRLMVMNAGAGFHHEETMPSGEDVHMLQIFVRPRAAGLAPAVQFAELEVGDRDRSWRLLVAPDDDPAGAPATVRQDVTIRDAHLARGTSRAIALRDGYDQWLYVFSGAVRTPDGGTLGEGAAVAATGDDWIDRVEAEADSDLVLFELGHAADYTMAGSLSRGR